VNKSSSFIIIPLLYCMCWTHRRWLRRWVLSTSELSTSIAYCTMLCCDVIMLCYAHLLLYTTYMYILFDQHIYTVYVGITLSVCTVYCVPFIHSCMIFSPHLHTRTINDVYRKIVISKPYNSTQWLIHIHTRIQVEAAWDLSTSFRVDVEQ
jgi:hypothetical protein